VATFVVLEEVVAEINAQEQRARLTQALDRRDLERATLSDIGALTLFSKLTPS
jgi:hypothetical protein